MTQREKVLAGVLGTLLVGGVFGVGGYAGLYKPVADKLRSADAARKEADEKRFDLAVLRKNLGRLPAAYAKSLPADPVVARQEYEFALNGLLRDAKVPRGYTLTLRQAADSRAIPELSPKVPAYQRVIYDITMKPVDLGTLTDFLERYHKLGLLHQITKLTIKRPENQTTAARRGSAGDRADLDVALTTEAIILDGVDGRRTLRPVPYAPGALVGSAGLHHLTQSPDLGRAVAAPAAPSGLATMAREYLAVLAKNPFHGPLPPPPPPPPTPKEPDPVPLEDISAFIKLTGIVRWSDGRGEADIKDTANNLDYEIKLTINKDGILTPKVEKFYYLKDRKKKLDSGTDLNISDDTSGTARKFRVAGIDDTGRNLILIAAPEPAADKAKPAAGRTFGGRPTTGKPTLSPAHPISAVAGGPTAGVPQDRVFVWPAGQSLNAVQELSIDDGLKAVERARSGWGTVPAATAVTRSPAN